MKQVLPKLEIPDFVQSSKSARGLDNKPFVCDQQPQRNPGIDTR